MKWSLGAQVTADTRPLRFFFFRVGHSGTVAAEGSSTKEQERKRSSVGAQRLITDHHEAVRYGCLSNGAAGERARSGIVCSSS